MLLDIDRATAEPSPDRPAPDPLPGVRTPAWAPRFCERAAFTPDGVTSILTGLGGLLGLRYARDL